MWVSATGFQQIFTLPSDAMHIADLGLLIKKIIVGVAVAAIPFDIVTGGLWLTRTLLDHRQAPITSAPSNAHH